MITVIIPSKNEPYLQKTVEDLYQHAEGEIEVLVGHDEEDQIGQRAQMNKLASRANGKYIMKLDAHCSMGQGFDRIMLEDFTEDMIMAPYLLPLDAEKWQVKPQPRHSLYYFDTNLVMQHGENNDELINETMCLQGSCFLMTTDNYWKWKICEEGLGSWGGQGSELGIKAFLNGGRCVTTKKTYYGHLFRQNELDFPYERDMDAIKRSQKNIILKYRHKNLIPLIEKWNFPCDWTKSFVNGLE
jgi:glycosyltransferase involved in cell wall biosynthesis